jgi:hypothetical protein
MNVLCRLGARDRARLLEQLLRHLGNESMELLPVAVRRQRRPWSARRSERWKLGSSDPAPIQLDRRAIVHLDQHRTAQTVQVSTLRMRDASGALLV